MKWIYRMTGSRGCLGVVRAIGKVGERRLGWLPCGRRLFGGLCEVVERVRRKYDLVFDRKYGTDTCGYIPLEGLTIRGSGKDKCIWYEPTCAQIFGQLIAALRINCASYTFVDFGSGKGRVLLLAAEHGFKRVVGVEFAEELHQVAVSNVARYQEVRKRQNCIETLCLDAREFEIPNGSVVLFFFTPFTGAVMQHVIDNITAATMEDANRSVIVLYYGNNKENLENLRRAGYEGREISLRYPWFQCVIYRGFIFHPPRRRGCEISVRKT